MTDVHQKLRHIEKLLLVLVDRYEKAQHEKDALELTIEKLTGELDEKNIKIQELEGELRAARVARGVASTSEDTDLAKAKINTLVREIDRCIALLNE